MKQVKVDINKPEPPCEMKNYQELFLRLLTDIVSANIRGGDYAGLKFRIINDRQLLWDSTCSNFDIIEGMLKALLLVNGLKAVFLGFFYHKGIEITLHHFDTWKEAYEELLKA